MRGYLAGKLLRRQALHKVITWRLIQRLFLTGMPRNLVCVRHGQSEGNVADMLYREGRLDSTTLAALAAHHGSRYRLTERGREDARLAGELIARHMRFRFHRLIASTHVRARETTAIAAEAAGISEAQWYFDPWQSERSWGKFEFFCPGDREEYLQWRKLMKQNPLHISLPGGESLLNAWARSRRPLYDTLNRECSGANVVVVSHGEIMWGDRFILERMTPERFLELEVSNRPEDRIPNGCILHYTREDPESGELSRYLDWYRIFHPRNPEHNTPWTRVIRPRFTAQEILQSLDAHPPVIKT